MIEESRGLTGHFALDARDVLGNLHAICTISGCS